MLVNISGKTITCSVSGGKDSTALWLYLTRDLNLEVIPIFADTGWEHDETYRYLDYLETAIGPLVRVKPALSFVELAQKKKRFPSTKCRFCTTELKLRPIRDYLRGRFGDDLSGLVMCSGVRAEESPSRAAMDEWCDTDDWYKCPQWRPILKWPWQEVFAIHAKYGVDPNPLYKQGMGRVGCMPCIMSNKRELGEIARRFPEVFEKVAAAESAMPGDHFSFWRPGDIPDRYCSRTWVDEKGKEWKIPKANDVREYVRMSPLERRANAFSLFHEPQNEDLEMCSSIYGLCE